MGIPKPPYIGGNRQKIVDTELILHTPSATGLTAAAAIATNGQACYISGTGAATYDTGGGYTEGYFVVNVTALPKMAAGGWFNIALQGALDSSFASAVLLAQVIVGDAAAPNIGHTEDQSTGVYVMPFSTLYGANIYRYLRGYVHTGGTPATGVTFNAFISC